MGGGGRVRERERGGEGGREEGEGERAVGWMVRERGRSTAAKRHGRACRES